MQPIQRLTFDTGIICKLFADVKLYCFQTSSQTQLQSALDKVVQWSHIWQLQLAPEKCQVFSTAGRKKKRNDPEYSINGLTLQRVDRVRDLGIMMDPCLKFVTHIDAITHKASAVPWMIRAPFSSRDQDVLKLTLCTYVRPILECSSPVCNPRHIRIEKIKILINQINAFCC